MVVPLGTGKVTPKPASGDNVAGGRDHRATDSSFSRHGVEHVESCGTADLKAAKKIHKGRLDKLASERQGHAVFLTPSDKKVAVGELLDALEADYRLRQVKSLPQCLSHLKRMREHFGAWRAAGLQDEAVDTYIQTSRNE